MKETEEALQKLKSIEIQQTEEYNQFQIQKKALDQLISDQGEEIQGLEQTLESEKADIIKRKAEIQKMLIREIQRMEAMKLAFDTELLDTASLLPEQQRLQQKLMDGIQTQRKQSKSTGLKLREIRESWTTKIVQLKSKNRKEEKQLKRELQAQLNDVEQNVINEQNNLIDVEDLIEVEQKRSESDIEEQIKADLEVEEDKAKVVMQDLELVQEEVKKKRNVLQKE